MDPATIAAILGPILGAGSTIAGASMASKDVSTSKIRRPSPDPVRDPLLSGVSLESLLGIGSTAGLEGIQEQGSPIAQFTNEIMRSDQLSDKQKRRAVNAIRWYQDRGLDPFDTSLLSQTDANGAPLVPGNIRKIRGEILRATQTVGFGGFNDWAGLMAAENDYQTKARAFQTQVAPIADQIRMNRIQGVANLADIAGKAGLRTDELAALYRPQIDREFQDERNRILQAANQGRFNPGAALGRLGDTQALTAQTSAIERALQILGGQSSITANALAPAQNLALQTSAQRQGATLNLANIGAAQSQAQQLLAQQRNESLGSGLAAAGNQIGNAALLYAILNQNPANQNMGFVGPQGNSVSRTNTPFNPAAGLLSGLGTY